MWIAEKIYYQGSSGYTRAYQGDELVWEQPTHNYITFTSLGSVYSPPSEITLGSLATGQTIEYSYDGYNWSSMTDQTAIEVNGGQSVYLRGTLSSNNTTSNYTTFNFTGDIKASGNINYLWNKDNPDAALKAYCGHKLFYHCSALSDVSELELPATTLAEGCYQYMFYGCTSLTTAPTILPATTLANWCYESMFQNCTSLTTVPVLQATTLADYCCKNMFKGCSSLTTAPVLPATTLVSNCYYGMFQDCTALVTAQALPATTLVGSCYERMFQNCTSLTTAPVLQATTLADYCCKNMFYGCRSLTTAPVLQATTLTIQCYYQMFRNCTSLNYIKCLATNISASQCTTSWVNNVASSGTFVKHPSMSSWTRGINGIPTNWTVVNEEVSAVTFTAKQANSTIGLSNISSYQTLEYSTDGNIWSNMTTATTISLSSGDTVYLRGTLLSNNSSSNYTHFKMTGNIKVSGNINYIWNYSNPTTTLRQYCGYALFNSCTALTEASELVLPATVLANNCYHNMFNGCTSLTTAPSVLPATTLVDSCYRSMFQNCSGLTAVPDLPATGLTNNCYRQFAQGTAIQRAPELPATTLANYCYRQIFYNCTRLNYIKCLATNISASNCTYNWVNNVSGSGTFVKASSMSSWTTGSNGIPSGWTIQNA